MTTLYLDLKDSRLRYCAGALEVRLAEQCVQRVPIEQLSRVVLASDVELSASVLRQLAAARVPLIVLRGRSRQDAVMLWPQTGDARRRLAQRRAFDDPATAGRLAALLVGLRIRAQQQALERLARATPRHRYAAQRAQRALARIRAGLSRQADIPALRGAEGAATRLYYAAWGRFLPAAVGFPGRRRRPPTDPVNAALSLGFSLLHARVLDVVHAAGLDAALGVLHDPSYNRPSLACDLVELERATIEAWVLHAFIEARLRAQDFTPDGNGMLLAKAARGTYFAAIEPLLVSAGRRTRRRVHRLIRWLMRTTGSDGVGRG